MTEVGKKKNSEALRIPFQLNVEYHYAAGAHATRFFTELRDTGRLFGVKCPACQRVYLPPRPVCGICFEPTSEWVQVSDEGVIVGCTVVNVPFIDPMTGEQRPVPYGFGIIRLDGAATAIYHFLEEKDPARMRVGQRVKAVFRERREGNLLDILHFRALD
jgi:uncharacterized OB-fold protein